MDGLAGLVQIRPQSCSELWSKTDLHRAAIRLLMMKCCQYSIARFHRFFLFVSIAYQNRIDDAGNPRRRQWAHGLSNPMVALILAQPGCRIHRRQATNMEIREHPK